MRMTPNDQRALGCVAIFIGLVVGAALLLAIAAITRMDNQVASDAHRQYCEDVALWRAEVERGVPLNRRAGQPDWQDIADEQCPARLQPMDHTAQRQLVQF
ncbi:hypothetical protein [Halomonas salina]|uniref:Uncharacterized protein n=1 Tax=Halomonas salina TaxID=42565 RepID=A0ABR4WUX6_9GAMM|nr:hypothetical protein [Halomonas salina]KGE78250.1 hypothetical protein FP66_04425 [Halomonas salina]